MGKIIETKKYVKILNGCITIRLPKTDQNHVMNLTGRIIPISALRAMSQ